MLRLKRSRRHGKQPHRIGELRSLHEVFQHLCVVATEVRLTWRKLVQASLQPLATMPSDSGKQSKQCLVKITCDLSEIFKMTNRKMFYIAVFTSKKNFYQLFLTLSERVQYL